MRVTFWGGRGTFPVTGAQSLRYGGDTMCVSVESGEDLLVLDAGTGLSALGAALAAREKPIAAHILLSHLHVDHIIGLTHFAPCWRADARVHLYAAEECLADIGEEALFSVLRPPLYPVEAGRMPAAIGLQTFRLGESFHVVGDVSAQSVALNHPGACAGFVLSAGERKLVYASDHEHGDAEADARLATAAQSADLLIYDATFTDAEAARHRGWGHSTWQEGVRLKRRSGARLLALAHHHPGRSSEELDRFAEEAARSCPNVFFARQGLSLTL